jgi:hypothetical protein
MMTGPQPVSLFIVHVVMPIGSIGEAVLTPSVTPSDTLTAGTTTIVARSIPTKSGMLPVVVNRALTLVTILGFTPGKLTSGEEI